VHGSVEARDTNLCENGAIQQMGMGMSRIMPWLAMVAILTAMLGGSAWAWAQVPADALLVMRSDSAGVATFDGLPAQGGLLPFFFCH
jgi:hypothetical protein